MNNPKAQSLPPRPRRVERGIEAVWSPRLQAWCWRARRQWNIEGKIVRRVGSIRRTQAMAAEDYARLDGDKAPRARIPLTLSEGLAAALEAAKERGVAADTAEAYDSAGRFLLRYWKADTQLQWITADEIRWFVAEAKADGSSPNTLRGKLLPLLSRCFRAAELPDPVPATLAELKGTLKRVPPRLEFFTIDEVRRIIERIRSEEFHDANGRRLTLPAREHQADVVTFFAATGVRLLEASRIRLQDVDLAQRSIHVRRPKDAGNPRRLFVGASWGNVVERLVERAEAERRAGDNPAGLLLPNLRTRAINIFRRWGERLGEPRLNNRVLRHSFVTAVLRAGGSPYDARILAGHRNLSTTDRYVGELTSRPDVLDAIDAALAPAAPPRQLEAQP